MESRAHIADIHTNHHFLNLQSAVHMNDLKIECSEYGLLVSIWPANSPHCKSIESHKWLILCLSKMNVPRMRQFLAAALQSGRSITTSLIGPLQSAWLHWEGHWLNLFNFAFWRTTTTLYSVPGLWATLCQLFIPTKPHSNLHWLTTEILRTNNEQMLVNHAGCCLSVLMWDEVATEQKLRWNAVDKVLYGPCRENGHSVILFRVHHSGRCRNSPLSSLAGHSSLEL